MSAPTIAPPVLVTPGDMEREAWLAERRNGIGASEVASILGINPYQGPLHVWLDKMGQLNWPGNAATKWGSRFEDDVLDEFVEQHPELIVTRNPGMFAVAAEPWRRASLDATAIDGDGLIYVEIKTGQSRNAGDRWGEPGTDQIPPEYLCQVTTACDVIGAKRWMLAFLPLDDLEAYAEYCGDFSPELAANLATRVRAWRDAYILTGIEPVADGLVDTTDILAGRYKPEPRTTAEISPEALLWQAGYKSNHEAINTFTEVKAEYGNLLRQELVKADVEIGLVNGVEVASWKRGPSGKRSFKVKGV